MNKLLHDVFIAPIIARNLKLRELSKQDVTAELVDRLNMCVGYLKADNAPEDFIRMIERTIAKVQIAETVKGEANDV